MKTEYKPILAVTMGDATGSGPEIITKSLAEPFICEICRPVVIGDAAVMREALQITGMSGEVRSIDNLSGAKFQEGHIEVVDLQNIDMGKLVRGQVNAMAGGAAYDYIKLAVELALAGKVDAVVTSAINKKAINNAGHSYNGHTELLAELCDAPEVTMMLVAGKLRVSHVSTHLSLRAAIDKVRPERILTVLRLTHEALREIGIDEPHIAVAGLNPHAGEGGLFGDEEAKFIIPAIEEGRRRGLRVSGPYPGDTVFFRTLQGDFDAAVAMYHDQGHVAAKMLGIWQGVNITLGLPIIRTSVEHGTDFENAGKGTSDPRSLNEALKLAAAMAVRRKSAASDG